MQLRDMFWLWGHPEGRYNGMYGNTGISRMTPMEACLYLGIRNTFMVPVGVHVNRRQYNKSFTTLRSVGWECFGADEHPEKIEQLLEEAREFPNIKAAVFDDFVGQNNDRVKQGKPPVTAQDLERVRERLHHGGPHPIETWMVLYISEFGEDEEKDRELQKICGAFDGVIMWNWKEKHVAQIPEKFEYFKKLTPNTRRMFGCYLYNFGENKQATPEAVLWQLDFYREKIMAGEAEGVVFHTNTMADLDYPAYDAAISWMQAHGAEPAGPAAKQSK